MNSRINKSQGLMSWKEILTIRDRNACNSGKSVTNKKSQSVSTHCVFHSLLEQLKAKQMELEDDRKFLDYEIRDSRLQNKMLKITLSKSHN